MRKRPRIGEQGKDKTATDFTDYTDKNEIRNQETGKIEETPKDRGARENKTATDFTDYTDMNEIRKD